MLQPTQYDAVLGGQSQQLKSYDVVLGGKSSVHKAIEMLKNPECYEQAKKVLLAQPKTTHRKLELTKFKSAEQASEYMRSIIEFGKQIQGQIGEYTDEFKKNKAFIWFSTPSIKRVGFRYLIDPNNLCKWDEYGHKVQLHNFMRRVIKETGKYHRDSEVVCRIAFKDLQTIIEELPNAFNFRFVEYDAGLVEPQFTPDYCNYECDYAKNHDSKTLIDHYWDVKNSRMILLP